MMFGALLKKQLMEVNTWLFQNKRTGKKRSGVGFIGFLLLYIFIFGWLGVAFFVFGVSMCEQLNQAGFGWLYFALMGLIGVTFGILGSVFSTYTTLYKAKDNEFLLSLPIPSRFILSARLFGVWFWSFIYVAIVFFPALLAYWIKCSPAFWAVVFDVLMLFALSIFVLTLSCILGWGVAKISGKLKNKNIVIVIGSLVFIALYYIGYNKAYSFLQNILSNVVAVSGKIKGAAYPLYLLGRMGEGDLLSAFFFTLMVLAFFAVVCVVLSKTFIKMATSAENIGKAEYKEKSVKAKTPNGALLEKEFRRFLGSPAYMLNCALGTVLIPVLGIVVLAKPDVVQSVLHTIGEKSDPSIEPLIVCAIMCSVAAINDITAPSVSLEGKNLWIAQSLPVSAWQVLKAKIKLHLALTEISVLFCAVCFAIAARLEISHAVFVVLLPMMFVFLSASFGLMLNLKMPNLSWTNETAPVKQSISVVISLFSSWIFVAVLAAVYFFLRSVVGMEVFFVIAAMIIAVLSAMIVRWLKKKGTRIFEGL